MLFRLLKFSMTGNIWGGQQSLPHSWANFPSEFNTPTECRYMQNEMDALTRPSLCVITMSIIMFFLFKKNNPFVNRNVGITVMCLCAILLFFQFKFQFFLCCLLCCHNFLSYTYLEWWLQEKNSKDLMWHSNPIMDTNLRHLFFYSCI